MDRKKFLIGAVFSLILIGVIGAATPFYSSMSPNTKAEAALERLDISKIKTGVPLILSRNPVQTIQIQGYTWSFLLFKKQNGNINVFDIPVKHHNVGMPDYIWYRPFNNCSNFGPTIVDDIIDESAPIKCHDYESDPPWWASRMWNIDGKAITSHTPDMLPTKGKVEGKYFVFGKKS